MSFGFNTNTRSKEDISFRLKQHNVKRAREETQKLETESRKMEERLAELRLAMNKEKEERERQGGGYWSRGQTGNLNSYATDVLNKPSSSSKSSGKKKVKVLKDTPLDVPDRPSQPGTMAYIAKQDVSSTPRQKVKGPKCGQCEEKKAAVSCVQCSELYCPGCFAAFHLKGALKKHRSIPVSATGPRQCMSPRPTPPITNGNGDFDSHNHSSENFDSYPSENAIHPAHSSINRVRFNDQGRNSPEGASGSFDGPSLFDGDYNEAESAASFQAALAAWRTGKSEGEEPAKESTTRQPQVLKVETPRQPVPMGVDSGTETKKPPPVEIKFSSNLTYAERLLLKKHRQTDIEKTDTPRVSLPATPRLNFPSMPDDNHSEVQMPFTPRSQQTPRIEAYPQRSKTEDEDQEEDMEDELEERVNFKALYELSKASSNTSVGKSRHDEDNISIIELDTVITNPTIEETTEFVVQEVSDLEAWTVKESENNFIETQRSSKPPKSSKRRAESRTENSIITSPENMSAKPPIRTEDRLGSGKVKDSIQDQTRTESRMKSGKVRPFSAKSRPPSSRAKSRQDSQRPGSRTRSRAGSRMEGEGCLTKAPSEALSMVAQMSAEVKVQRSVPLEELFMIGVTPVQQDRVMTPSRAKSAKDDRMKVSNQLYQMAPRSWRPDSSLAENATDAQVEPVEDPLAVPMETDAIDMVMDANSYHSNTDGVDAETPTPRAPSRSDSLLRDSTLPDFNFSHPTAKQRSPEPPREKSFRQPSQHSKSRSSHQTLTPRIGTPGAKPSDNLEPTDLQSSTTFGSCPHSRGVDQIGARSVSRSGTGITPRSARASSRFGGQTPRADGLERPVSRAIVVDGEDLSSYDAVGDQENRNMEDQESLNKLEWELASESGRITADGQISRMSILPDTDDEGSTGSSRSFSRMSQQDQGYDINSRLREDELLDDEEQRESDEENEVKALH
ncbi:uncharacterized protein LOC133186611 [Saccostrea echinata]|uniref:uncharacterized protein LOC133186611 n=1 Tax=Saccostrea echinata TaxID=191078 RepID=UPI002A81B5A6|nr:uncharacterized protein LOC133186611 [Saccostrea echinata]